MHQAGAEAERYKDRLLIRRLVTQPKACRCEAADGCIVVRTNCQRQYQSNVENCRVICDNRGEEVLLREEGDG
jgi:hypothetical protein